MPNQLALPFSVRSAHGREDFIVAPPNEQAFRFVERWPDWPARVAAIRNGPKGCGKTHLACVAGGVRCCAYRSVRVVARCSGRPRRERAIAVEDLDSTEPSEQRDRALLALFERPVGWLLFTALRPPLEWRSVIGGFAVAL
jgi:hypothetical protein